MTQKLKQVYINNTNLKMSNRVRNIDLKNRTYYFLDDIINTKNFNPNYIKKRKDLLKLFLFTILDM